MDPEQILERLARKALEEKGKLRFSYICVLVTSNDMRRNPSHARICSLAIGLALALTGRALAVSEADRVVCDEPLMNPDRSINACSGIIETSDPGYVLAIAYLNRGLAYREKGDETRAIDDFDEAISLNPEYAEAYFNRGTVHNGKGDYDRAIADFGQAILLDPKDAGAYNNRGIAYKNKGEYGRAISDFDEALRIDPQFKAAVQNRESAMEQLGRRP